MSDFLYTPQPHGDVPQCRSRLARASQSDGVADSDIDEVNSRIQQDSAELEQARREARITRQLASAALLLSGLAMVVISIVVFHYLQHNPVFGDGRNSFQREAIDLNENHPNFREMAPLRPGWARSMVSAVVRKSKDVDSERVAVIPIAQQVLITEVHGRRVHITQPIDGWISSMSRDGIQILRNDDSPSEHFSHRHRGQSSGNAPGGHNVTEALAKLKDQVLKFQGLQRHILKALEYTNQRMSDKHLVHQVADVATQHASEAVDVLKDAVKDISRLDPNKVANDLLKRIVQLPGGANILNPSEKQAPKASNSLDDLVE